MKKTIYLVTALLLLAALAACSAIQSLTGQQPAANQPAGANTTGNGQGTGNGGGRGGFGGDPTKMTVEQKMGIGILKLEGTDNAVTAQQAKDLLPLWQALKSMQTSNNASVDEIKAVFSQMKDTLTPGQVTAIQGLTWTQADMTAIMQQYGIGNGFGGQNGTASPAQQQTRAAARANGGGGFPGGGGPGGPGGGGQGGFGGNGGNGGTSSGGATRTPSPAQLNRQAMGFNSIFIDPVIKLLTTKAGG